MIFWRILFFTFHYWRCFVYQHVGVGECGWRNRRSSSSLVLHCLRWCQWSMELEVAFMLSERKYMALNKSVNTSNARAISSTCRPPSTFHHTRKKRKYNTQYSKYFTSISDIRLHRFPWDVVDIGTDACTSMCSKYFKCMGDIGRIAWTGSCAE